MYLCTAIETKRGNSSVGRAQPCQGWGREFESRFPLRKSSSYRNVTAYFFVKSGYRGAKIEILDTYFATYLG